jgi:hypothetical protein
MQEKLRLDNSVRNGNRGKRVETQIGEAGHDLSLPKIVGSAVSGWTPTIGSQITSDKTIKRMGLSDPKTAYIQSPRRNTVRGLGGLLDKVNPEPGKQRGDDME